MCGYSLEKFRLNQIVLSLAKSFLNYSHFIGRTCNVPGNHLTEVDLEIRGIMYPLQYSCKFRSNPRSLKVKLPYFINIHSRLLSIINNARSSFLFILINLFK